MCSNTKRDVPPKVNHLADEPVSAAKEHCEHCEAQTDLVFLFMNVIPLRRSILHATPLLRCSASLYLPSPSFTFQHISFYLSIPDEAPSQSARAPFKPESHSHETFMT